MIKFYFTTMLAIAALVRQNFCLTSTRISTFTLSKFQRNSNKLFLSSSSDGFLNSDGTGDIFISALNADRDISIKIVSCREVVQETIMRNDLSPQAANTLGEVIACTLMMGSGLKNDETLQINLVGNTGLKNVMAITDGELKVRGLVGNPNYFSSSDSFRMKQILGEGQIQVVRNHPSWKFPSNGVVALRDTKIPLNLALYLAESEQRTSVLITDVKVEGTLCRYALGLMIERLPGATEANIETSVNNLVEVERRGLRSYLTRTKEELEKQSTDSENNDNLFRSLEPSLGNLLDDCLKGLGENFRMIRTPLYRCSCSVDKIWRALTLLSKDDIQSMVDDQQEIEMKCDFCGEVYRVPHEEIRDRILIPSSADKTTS